MAEIDRLHQYRYLIRAMRLEDARSLEVSRAFFLRQGINVFDDDFVFRETPHNDDFAQVTTDFFEMVRHHKVPGRRGFTLLLKHYLAIFFDEVGCHSWSLYLALADGELCSCCEFCGRLRGLDGMPMDSATSVIANRKFLVERFGAASEPQWPSLARLAALQHVAR